MLSQRSAAPPLIYFSGMPSDFLSFFHHQEKQDSISDVHLLFGKVG